MNNSKIAKALYLEDLETKCAESFLLCTLFNLHANSFKAYQDDLLQVYPEYKKYLYEIFYDQRNNPLLYIGMSWTAGGVNRQHCFVELKKVDNPEAKKVYAFSPLYFTNEDTFKLLKELYDLKHKKRSKKTLQKK